MIGVARRILDSMLLQQHIRLSQEVLCTLMSEVSAIINARPLVPVSSDPDNPYILTPAVLYTQKVGAPPGEFSNRTSTEANGNRCKLLPTRFGPDGDRSISLIFSLQCKWNKHHRNLQKGDVVLLKDSQITRNEWPMALVTSTFPSQDGKVRKVKVKISSQGNPKTFLHPISEVIPSVA